MSNPSAPVDDNRIRPGFVAVLVGALALIMISIWLYGHRVRASDVTVIETDGAQALSSQGLNHGDAMPSRVMAASSEPVAVVSSTLVAPNGRILTTTGVMGSGIGSMRTVAEVNQQGVAATEDGLATPAAEEIPQSCRSFSNNSGTKGASREPVSASEEGKSIGQTAESAVTSSGKPPTPSADPMETRWGIRLSGMGLAQVNGAVQMTYQVTDYAQAMALLRGKNSDAYLIDLASGTEINLAPPQSEAWPFTAHSKGRSMNLAMRDAGTFPPPPNRLVAGKTYVVLVPNPAGLIKSGSSVVVVAGGVRSETLTVE